MPFWLHEIRVTKTIKHVSLRHRLALSLSAILGCVLSLFLFFYIPMQHFIHSVVVFQKDMLHQKHLFITPSSQIKNVANEQEERQEILHQAALSYHTIQMVVKRLFKAVQHNNLLCTDMKPVHAKAKTFFAKEYIDFAVSGAFNNIIKFLENVSHLSDYIHVSSLYFVLSFKVSSFISFSYLLFCIF